MSMIDRAKKEVEIAIKRENPNWDGKSFDYGCSCYQSALKAFNILAEDGHSGFSWGITKNILIRLMDGLPLTSIKDEDFFIESDMPKESEEDLKEKGLKSCIQCPRMSSLFREETIDGKISYSDVSRYYCVDKNGSTFSGGKASKIIDELFPIKIPYFPSTKKYVFYTDDFLLDLNNGDFDHEAIMYVITPEGEKIELDEYYKEVNGKIEKITKEEYFKDKELVERK